MRGTPRGGAVSLGLLAGVLGCANLTDAPRADLAPVVQRDGLPFELPTIPEAVLDWLSAHRVVIVGETHLIREHREMMAAIVRALHARGFRQLLLEWPHMADWVVNDFVRDGGRGPGWVPPTWLFGDLITAMRDFNRTLPPEQRFEVRGIDVNLRDYGGASDFLGSLRALSERLADPGPVDAFLQGAYDTPERQTDRLQTLRGALATRESELVAAWGADWYETVAEMVEVELASVTVRALRDDHYDLSVRLREDVMKRLADLRLEGYPHASLINVGGNHAQKAYLKGTEQEWLGDYLVHRSNALGGSAIVLNVTPARIMDSAGAVTTYDIMDVSPENELFRVMHETWPDQIVFLPLDDSVFLEGVAMNFEEVIHVGAPKRIYDAFILLPLAHRVPLP
jgi:hypothetical protein